MEGPAGDMNYIGVFSGGMRMSREYEAPVK
jgi:hypothetical protein